MRENRLRWFNHVYRKPIVAAVRKIDCSEVTGISRREKDLKTLNRNNHK